VVALGVADPLLDDLDQLLQKAQALVVATDQGFLGQGNRERIVLAIGQPTLQMAMQIAVEFTNRIGQLRWLVLQAEMQQRSLCGDHLGFGNHIEPIGVANETHLFDLIATGG